MARMPGAEWVGPHHDNGVMTRYDVLCFHTIVGYAPAHAAHFSTRADGHIFQSRDTAYRSAANLNGNYRVLAVETEDHGPAYGAWSGSNVPAWTAQQIEAHAQIAAWANKVHGIPLAPCPDSRPTSRGIAFHRQGIPGNYSNGLVPGGELWSSSAGKVCPGDRRIAQMPQIIARARQLVGLKSSEECDMSIWTEDAKAGYDQIYRVLVDGSGYVGSALEQNLGYVVGEQRRMHAETLEAIASGDLDPESLTRRMETAARQGAAEATERAIATTVLPALRGVLTEVLGDDNDEQAEAIVAALARHLTTKEN